MPLPDARFTVCKVRHTGGQVSHWIRDPTGELHRPSVALLAKYAPSSQQTYAYCLMDHLNWAYVNGKDPETVSINDLHRYMNGLTEERAGVFGVAGRRPGQGVLGASAAANVAAIVKAYYINLGPDRVNRDLLEALSGVTSHASRSRPQRRHGSNPLATRRQSARPRFLPDEVVEALFEPGVLRTHRDLMIVTWLHDSGIRVGGLCGLRFSDLHLIRHHPCGQRADPHIHIVGRDDNPNRARAKTFHTGTQERSPDGHVHGGVVRAASPDMISTFYAYFLDEFHPVQHHVNHEQVLIHGAGPTPGAALTTSAVRKMLDRACSRAGLNTRVTPHAFRHKSASDLYAATGFNAEIVAQEFGWADADMVTNLYGRSANQHALQYLQSAWEATARPSTEAYLTSVQDEHERPGWW